MSLASFPALTSFSGRKIASNPSSFLSNEKDLDRGPLRSREKNEFPGACANSLFLLILIGD